MRSWSGLVKLVGLPALALLLASNTTTAYLETRDTVYASHDRALRAALLYLPTEPLISEDIRRRLAASLSKEEKEVFFSVTGPDGHTLAGESGLSYPSAHTGDSVRFSNAYYRGRAIRIAAAHIGANDYLVAESVSTRVELVHRLTFTDLQRQLWLSALGIVLVWLGLRTVRHDLGRMAEQLARREAENLAPLATDELSPDARPLADAINGHLAKLAGLLNASRRFAADVAHQLRTPLTLLGAQAQYGLRQDDATELRKTIGEIAAASRGAQRLCNQMLSLSRVESANNTLAEGSRFDLATLLRETALDLSMLALEKRIDLAFECTGGAVDIVGNEIMLHELFANLIDNALRYTPCDGMVRVSLTCADGRACVEVADSGPGIPVKAREVVFQRFHRHLDRAGGSGSGLGLAIAHQIALAHGGSLILDDGPDGRGLVARVHLPLPI